MDSSNALDAPATPPPPSVVSAAPAAPEASASHAPVAAPEHVEAMATAEDAVTHADAGVAQAVQQAARSA